jgi:hypothetical protein
MRQILAHKGGFMKFSTCTREVLPDFESGPRNFWLGKESRELKEYVAKGGSQY